LALFTFKTPAGTAGHEVQPVVLKGGRAVTALATSADDHNVAGFVFASGGEDDGSGTPFAIAHFRTARRVFRNRTLDRTNPEGIAWRTRNELYISADDGIYIWRLGEYPKRVWKGVTAGLALSDDGTRIAFWDLGEDDAGTAYALEVITFDGKELRKWNVPTRYAQDKSGFDLAFSKDGSRVYARTFDTDDVRPLKAFNLFSGVITTVSKDSMSLAANADGIFSIERSGEAYSLSKLESEGTSKTVESHFLAPRLTSNRAGHLLISPVPVSGTVWVYDTSHGAMRSFRTACDHVAAFSDGTMVFARKDQLVSKCE
jgi:hypothetical protein